jgi:hypothetical protein
MAMLKFFLWTLGGWLAVPPLLVFAWYFLAGGERLLRQERFDHLLREAGIAHAQARQAPTPEAWACAREAYLAAQAASDGADPVTALRLELDLVVRIPMERRDDDQDAVDPLVMLDALEKRANRLGSEAPDDDRAYKLWRDVRSLQAEALYAIAQKNRREDAKAVPDWKAPADRSRDCYRELLNAAKAQADADAFARFQRNLEVVVNMLRIEEEVFEGLPFPDNSPASKDCLKRSRKYQAQEQERHRAQTRAPDRPAPIEMPAPQGKKTS